MKIAFRTDASSQIGTGHFMRCLTFAEALKKQGADICFISRNLPLHLSEMLNLNGIKFITLSANDNVDSIDELAHASWLGVSQAQDAQETVKSTSGEVYDWMIVDHYALDMRWESIVRPNVKKIMVIDDLADRHHDCDILLDQNYYADMQTRYNGKVPSNCQLLLGPNYALLREEFRAFKEMIEHACTKHGYVCHVQTSYMAKLMADADLAIGAGGSASWERCCLGLPSLLVALADNQIAIAKELSAISACTYIGNRDEVSLKKWLTQFIANQELTKKISENAFSIVDGLGVHRVIKEMGCYL